MTFGVWNDRMIREACERLEMIEPYNPDHVNPASIDLTLGSEFIDLHTDRRFTADEITIRRGDAILATTAEYVRIPNTAAGQLLLKSSSARNGLDHALAGFCDPGFAGQLTLEIHSHRDVTYKAGSRIVQLVLFVMAEPPEKPYQGRYLGQKGPTKAR